MCSQVHIGNALEAFDYTVSLQDSHDQLDLDGLTIRLKLVRPRPFKAGEGSREF